MALAQPEAGEAATVVPRKGHHLTGLGKSISAHTKVANGGGNIDVALHDRQ